MTIPIRLGIVGGGVVGRATARVFIEHVTEVRVYDTLSERATHSLEETLACDLVMLCLPTPQMKDSLVCDTGYVEDFLSECHGEDQTRNYVIRSTVPIGFTATMRQKYNLPNLIHSPEFLTARVAATDAHLPSRNVIGTHKTSEGRLPPCALMLDGLYRQRFPGIPVHLMTTDESEAVKLFQNGFFALKVSYWNECHTLATAHGLDWYRVMAGVLADGRISHSHTRVPGPSGTYGYGGECLTKDVANLIDCFEQAGLGAEVIRGAHTRNQRDRLRPTE